MGRISKGAPKDKLSLGQPIFYFVSILAVVVIYMIINSSYTLKAKIVDKGSLEISPPPAAVPPAASRTLAPAQAKADLPP